jgi:hypothetical protein
VPAPDPAAPYVANAPAGMSSALLVPTPASAEAVRWHHDYDWTHGQGVEGFFVVLTVVVVPFAVLRWYRRIRDLSERALHRRGNVPS